MTSSRELKVCVYERVWLDLQHDDKILGFHLNLDFRIVTDREFALLHTESDVELFRSKDLDTCQTWAKEHDFHIINYDE